MSTRVDSCPPLRSVLHCCIKRLHAKHGLSPREARVLSSCRTTREINGPTCRLGKQTAQLGPKASRKLSARQGAKVDPFRWSVILERRLVVFVCVKSPSIDFSKMMSATKHVVVSCLNSGQRGSLRGVCQQGNSISNIHSLSNYEQNMRRSMTILLLAPTNPKLRFHVPIDGLCRQSTGRGSLQC
jgi:hypothetical protein